RLLADLESDQFPVRNRASRELEALAELAEPELRAALAGKPSLELRGRLQKLLETLEQRTPSGAQLHALRALEVLEYMRTEEAQQLLTALAKGAPEARFTQEAKAALARLAQDRR